MTEFVCRLGTPAGEVVTKTVEASNEREARARFENEGFRVFSVASANAAFAGLGNRRVRIKPADFLLFNQQLSALLRAGIPILQSISMLRKRAASERLREVLADVEEKIRSGTALSDALAEQEIFPRIYTASILAGERSGALDEVLARYVAFMKKSVGLQRKVRGALAYPIFLMIASIIMIGFLSIYVVPKMANLFSGISSKKGLPTVTVIVVAISNTIASNIWWLVPLAIILSVLFYLWARTANGRMAIDRAKLRVPLFGKLIVQMTTAQVTRSMATLLAGGITVPESWEIASESISNVELRRRSEAVLPMIREGIAMTDALERAVWLPELALDMIGIGERSGSLREMLDEVAQFYDAESEVRLEQLTSLLEPVILVVMAGVVVTILLAIYLPIIQMLSSGPGGMR